MFPWLGAKTRLAPKLLPLFDNQHTTYVEPFAGGGGMFFQRPEPSRVEVLNDINGELVNLYRVVQHHLDEFIRQFRWALTSRQVFLWEQQRVPESLTDIQRAARWYYLQRLAFGGRATGQTFGTSPKAGPRLNLLRLEEDLSAVHLRLAHVTIEHLDWRECIERYDRPETFFFLDPPYWKLAGYGVPFGWDQYEALAVAMRRLKGKALLTLNDHPDIRALFAGLRTTRLTTHYTVGGGRGQPRSELAIRSW
ncbi:hypothetical protein MBSD_n1555 [Mizugakiibacter sediminis]|nr:hypothetical protein MBSD_n1555 [Mizugakiibacter sediminis]